MGINQRPGAVGPDRVAKVEPMTEARRPPADDPWPALTEGSVDPDPLVQFDRWFDQAATVLASPEAMALATATPDGRPSVRMVLLKAWGPDGFVFHTNYDSRKGHELADNPSAALLFYWEPLGRQVRIEGAAERTTDDESDAYFVTRPPGGQIGARASHQSRPIAGRELLDARVAAVEAEFAGGPVPRPPWWGGVRLRPRSFEFWQNRADRLHDRILYTPQAVGWTVARLQP
jgi:pyridoxamine 5'-phosphate oxidase